MAAMTSTGHVDIDPSEVARLTARLHESIALSDAESVRAAHRRRLGDLVSAGTDTAKALTEPWDIEVWTASWHATSEAIAALAPYGLVTKILPDVLLERMGARPAHDLDTPRSGDDQLANRLSSRSLVFAVQDLLRRLDRVADMPAREALIAAFCRRRVGFGPTAWEAPGYEDMTRVRTLVAGQPSPIHSAPIGPAVDRHRPDPAAASQAGPWEHHVRYWTQHMDSQTTILRWAFLTILLPLLRQFARHRIEISPADFLFMTRQEIPNALPSQSELTQRRERYRRLLDTARQTDLGTAAERVMIGPEARVPADVETTGNVHRPDVRRAARSMQGTSVSTREQWTGRARLVTGSDIATPSPPGSVVVASHLSPDLTPAILGAGAVVVEEDGMLQHAAIITREMEIPCVVGCRHLLDHVTTGMLVTVDGQNGRVTIQPG